MKSQEIAACLSDKFGERVLDSQAESMNPHSVIEPAAILDVCRFMRDEDSLRMDHLELLGGVDYKDRIEVVYVLYSMRHQHRYTLKCRLPREGPSVATVESVWAVANWHERETYDMLGVVFEGHSDFRRILCPDDWEGYPLRKDYEFPKEYRELPV
jgi:NADH-quinone oxidoreductase subunit C